MLKGFTSQFKVNTVQLLHIRWMLKVTDTISSKLDECWKLQTLSLQNFSNSFDKHMPSWFILFNCYKYIQTFLFLVSLGKFISVYLETNPRLYWFFFSVMDGFALDKLPVIPIEICQLENCLLQMFIKSLHWYLCSVVSLW